MRSNALTALNQIEIEIEQSLSTLVSDSCNITVGNETVQQYETNPNPLTEPEILFYWEIILLVLHLALAGTSIILQRLGKEVGKNVSQLP